MCLRFAKAGNFDCMLLAGRYTLLEQGALDDFLLYAEAHQVSAIIGGPYNSGILAGDVPDNATHDYMAAPRPLIEKARHIAAICQRRHVPLAAAALQFPLAHPAVSSVIPGALSAQEVHQNLSYLRRAIPPALWQELKAERLLTETVLVPA